MQSEHLICVVRKIYFYSVFSFFFFLSSSSSSSSSFFVLFRRDDVLSVHLLPLPARSLYSPTACLPACLCVITFIFLSFFFAVAASAVCILFRRPSVGWTVTADEMETLNRGGFFFILFVSHLNVVLILVELAATFLRRWTIVYKKKCINSFSFPPKLNQGPTWVPFHEAETPRDRSRSSDRADLSQLEGEIFLFFQTDRRNSSLWWWRQWIVHRFFFLISIGYSSGGGIWIVWRRGYLRFHHWAASGLSSRPFCRKQTSSLRNSTTSGG